MAVSASNHPELEIEAKFAAEIERNLEARRLKEVLSKLPLDKYDTGQVLVFSRQFKEDGPTYTYAAVKGGEVWYLTGRNGTQGGMSWAQLMAAMYARGLDGIKLFTVSTMDEVKVS